MPAVDGRAVRVSGLRELERAFARADKTVVQDMRHALTEAAEPVRRDASRLAAHTISGIPEGDRWARMRIGSYRSIVYVAPEAKGVTGRGLQSMRRPNLAGLLLGRAMEPALDQNQARVVERLEGLIDEVADVWEAR